MKAPEGKLGETLQESCKNLKVLLVDERSLIWATTLGWMEFMCSYGVGSHTGSTRSWGGLPVVIFLGDDVQLPPVCDFPVFSTKGKTQAAIHGALVWQEFKSVVDL